MSRKTGQLIALLGIIVLVIVVVWYQYSLGGQLKSQVTYSEIASDVEEEVGEEKELESEIVKEEKLSEDLQEPKVVDGDVEEEIGEEVAVTEKDIVEDGAEVIEDELTELLDEDDEMVAEEELKVTLTAEPLAAVRGTSVLVTGLIENFAGENIDWIKLSGPDVQQIVNREAVDESTVRATYSFSMPMVDEDLVLMLRVGDLSQEVTIQSIAPGEQVAVETVTTDDETDVDTDTSEVETEDTSAVEAIAENPPDSSASVDGKLQNKYIVPYDELVVLDALQVPLHVPSFTTNVRWVPDLSNFEAVFLDDEFAVRTSFKTPSEDGELKFALQVQQGNQYVPVAEYVFTVVHPLVVAADANRDGKYDFSDLVNLLQKWDSFGDDATKVMSVILSNYEE